MAHCYTSYPLALGKITARLLVYVYLRLAPLYPQPFCHLILNTFVGIIIFQTFLILVYMCSN